MLTICYHSSDPFSNSDASARFTYYGVGGIPDTWIDGTLRRAGTSGNVHQDSVTFAGFYNQRRAVTSPLSVTLNGTYNPGTRSGQVVATITNTDSSAITNHNLRYAIVETVPYNWQWTDTCWEVCRKMLPNASGVTVSLDPGQTVADSQNFTMGSGWVDAKTWLVAFVQNDANKLIVQGGWIPLSSLTGLEEQTIENRRLMAACSFKAMPNPFASYATVPGHESETFSLYDISGRKAGTYQGNRIGMGLKIGVYFLKVEGKDAKPVRVVKVR